MPTLIDATVCAEASNCPRIAELPGGDFAVTGVLAGGDGTEATVIVPGAVMTAALEQVRAAGDGGE